MHAPAKVYNVPFEDGHEIEAGVAVTHADEVVVDGASSPLEEPAVPPYGGTSAEAESLCSFPESDERLLVVNPCRPEDAELDGIESPLSWFVIGALALIPMYPSSLGD